MRWSRVFPLFPPHECYVELFSGGAALYFLRQVPAPVEVLNDVNGELINLYRVVANLKLHLYGKHHARPGRKMGHFTVIGEDAAAVLEAALAARAAIGIKGA